MELSKDGLGAGRLIREDEVEMAAAVFLSVHRDCGETPQILLGTGRLVCYCEPCKVSRLYTYELQEQAP